MERDSLLLRSQERRLLRNGLLGSAELRFAALDRGSSLYAQSRLLHVAGSAVLLRTRDPVRHQRSLVCFVDGSDHPEPDVSLHIHFVRVYSAKSRPQSSAVYAEDDLPVAQRARDQLALLLPERRRLARPVRSLERSCLSRQGAQYLGVLQHPCLSEC